MCDSGGVGMPWLALRSMVLARSRTVGVEGGDSCTVGSTGGGFLIAIGGGASLVLRGIGLGGGFLGAGRGL